MREARLTVTINVFASQAMPRASWLILQTFMHFELGGKRELDLPAMSHDHTSQQSKAIWAINLHPVGLHYYAGVVDNAEELLESHKVATQSSFGTRISTKKATSHVPGPANKEN